MCSETSRWQFPHAGRADTASLVLSCGRNSRAASEFYSFCRKRGKDCFGLHDWLLRCCNPFPKASMQIMWCQLKGCCNNEPWQVCSSNFENAATVFTAIELRSSCLSDSFFLEVSTFIFPLVGFPHSNDVARQYMPYRIRVEDCFLGYLPQSVFQIIPSVKNLYFHTKQKFNIQTIYSLSAHFSN